MTIMLNLYTRPLVFATPRVRQLKFLHPFTFNTRFSTTILAMSSTKESTIRAAVDAYLSGICTNISALSRDYGIPRKPIDARIKGSQNPALAHKFE